MNYLTSDNFWTIHKSWRNMNYSYPGRSLEGKKAHSKNILCIPEKYF
jgi:hypothetical protein